MGLIKLRTTSGRYAGEIREYETVSARRALASGTAAVIDDDEPDPVVVAMAVDVGQAPMAARRPDARDKDGRRRRW